MFLILIFQDNFDWSVDLLFIVIGELLLPLPVCDVLIIGKSPRNILSKQRESSSKRGIIRRR